MRLKATTFLLCLLAPFLLSAQQPAISWKVSAGAPDGDSFEIVFTGTPASGWHSYGTGSEYSAPALDFTGSVDCVPDGKAYDITCPVSEDGEPVFHSEFRIGQKMRITGKAPRASGTLTWTACTGGNCTRPTDWEFSVEPAAGAGSKGSIPWALIIEAILWGLAMLLTPCVFPMVPMTVSFFLKGSANPAQGRFKAAMYGLFIVLLYTLPICAIIGITRLAGGDAVTADIFNWLATHWIPNLLFFIIFMAFAASFFGAFEITLPSSLVNGSDRKAEKGGLGGVFFMALTLVLVSFSCTGPIVGSVLIRSTRGEFWTPMVTMLAFSVAFALPFTLLALFPSVLKKLKSGSWLGSVKIVLGFVEVALGLKFLSVADQTYHWGILDREVYLAIWITVFSLLGLYLLGKIRFKGDDLHDRPLGVFRLTLAIAVFSFVVYMVPGMWGAPLKALSGYLPPIQTQDFICGTAGGGDNEPAIKPEGTASLPYGLRAYTCLEDALEASLREGKPVFADITGHGCVNCREMEQRVWSDPEVLGILRDSYIMLALYTDDKTRLPESEWVRLPSGRILKDMGQVNSLIARDRFDVNSQPSYILLDGSGRQLAPVRGYNLDPKAFAEFLLSGILAFND